MPSSAPPAAGPAGSSARSCSRGACAASIWARTQLEIGLGFGATTSVLARRPRRADWFLELSASYCQRLRHKLGDSVEIVHADATAMPFADGRFSSVVCFTMLHHVPTPQLQDRLLAEAARVLRPGGAVRGHRQPRHRPRVQAAARPRHARSRRPRRAARAPGTRRPDRATRRHRRRLVSLPRAQAARRCCYAQRPVVLYPTDSANVLMLFGCFVE